MNATTYLLHNPDLLLATVFGQLPAVAIFFGITHLVLRQYIKVNIRGLVPLAYLIAPALVLGLFGWEWRGKQYGAGINLIVPLVLSALACGCLYYHGWRRRLKDNQSTGTVNTPPPFEFYKPQLETSGMRDQIPSGIIEVPEPSNLYCDQCGTASTSEAKFCRSCGHNLKALVAVAPSQRAETPEIERPQFAVESTPIQQIKTLKAKRDAADTAEYEAAKLRRRAEQDAATKAERDAVSESKLRRMAERDAAAQAQLKRQAERDAAYEAQLRHQAELDAAAKAERNATKLRRRAERDAALKAEQDAALKAEKDAALKAEQDAATKAKLRRQAEFMEKNHTQKLCTYCGKPVLRDVLSCPHCRTVFL